jgi:PKD repeat protein
MHMKGVLTITMMMLAAALLVLPVSGAFAVTGISPDSGINTGVVLVDLSGTDLPADASVKLVMPPQPTITASSVIEVDSTRIIAAFDLAGKLAGDRTVIVVNNTDGSEAILEGKKFSVENLPPSITSITPDNGINNQANLALTLTGTDFLPGARVNLKDGTFTIPAVVSEVTKSQIACTVDLTGAVAGPWSVVVTNPDGKKDRITNGFTVLNPVPTVAAIAPTGSTNNGVSGLIDLTGTGFFTGASVTLKKAGEPDIGAMGIPTVVNPTQILCYFDLTDASVGAWDVVVTNTDLQSGTLPAGLFISYPQAPQVLGIVPSGGVNTGMVSISSLTGTGFEEGASVILKKANEPDIPSPNPTVVSPTEITCDLDLAGAAEGPWDVMVINDDGQSGVLAGGFQVRFPAPQITGISPSVGLNDRTVSISHLAGADFRSPATVKLTRPDAPDIPATGVAVVNAGKITCNFNLAGAKVGLWNLVVTNPDGQSASAANTFTVENPAPSISKITPNKGPNDSSVFISALNGTGFLPGATVRLTKTGQAAIIATDVSVQSPTQISCTLNLAGKATGKWNVVVRNTDGKGDLAQNAFTVTLPPPAPDFTATPVFGTAPLTVQFSDLSTNAPYLWSWNFGDGFSSAGLDQEKPVHTYNEPGVYSVSLRVRNEGGEVEVTKNNYITVVLTPVASFTAEPKSGPAPLLVKFTDTSDGDPTRYYWRFGDRGSSTEKNPYYLYQTPGIYTVSLTVYNAAGSDTETITDLIEVTSLPVAAFSADVTSGESPLAVQFKDTSSGQPTAWLWKFGDGGNSAQQNPVYVFANPGTYSVQLTVTNTAGSSTATKDGYITVSQDMHADFEFAPSNPANTAPLTVAFTDKSTGKVTRWAWNFGDRYGSDDRNPIHNFANPGTYAVTLSITGPSGSDSMTKTITVKSPLKADFIADPTTGSAPLTVMFSDVSVGTVVERTWIISKDPGNIIFIRPGAKDQIYTFNEPGLYSVTMNVVDAFGEPDAKERTGYINVLPFPQ